MSSHVKRADHKSTPPLRICVCKAVTVAIISTIALAILAIIAGSIIWGLAGNSSLLLAGKIITSSAIVILAIATIVALVSCPLGVRLCIQYDEQVKNENRGKRWGSLFV